MDRELEEEIEIDKRRIVYLCQRILAKDIDLILALREIYSLDWHIGEYEYITGEDHWFLVLFEDETELICKGNDRSHLSAEYAAKMDEQEKEILKFYEQLIIKFAEETIELLGIADTDQLYNQLTLALERLNVKKCIHLVKILITSEDKTCIGKLLTYFADNSNSEKTEILLVIAKKIEHYTVEILKNLSSMLSVAKDWAYYLLFNILKNPQIFSVFLQNKYLIEDQDLLILLEMISENDAKHISEMKSINELVKNLRS